MGKLYSDAEKILASELVYLDFDGYENQDLGSIIKEIEDAYKSTDKPDKKLVAQIGFVEDIKERAERNGVDNWESWIIKKVCNDNGPGQSGYYGMLIETEPGEAIISSRGSEQTGSQLFPDWINNDASFLDGDGTSQEVVSKRFMENIWYEYGHEYDSFTIAGHSLGGHLALHMAITAPILMQEKIMDATSFDGPGFSDEYIKNHRENIDRIALKMNHYKYSIVGGLLFPLPGVVPKIIKSSENKILDIFKRHSLWTIEIDENGNVIPGDERYESIIAGDLTRFVDAIDMGEWAVVALFYAISPGVMLPIFIIETVVVLTKTLVAVFKELKEVLGKVGKWIDDVKYRYLKPQVSGDYEMSTTKISDISVDVYNALKRAYIEAEEALLIVNSMKSTWTNCAYLRSKVKSSARAIQNDVERLLILNNIMVGAKETYLCADNSVAVLFS